MSVMLGAVARAAPVEFRNAVIAVIDSATVYYRTVRAINDLGASPRA
jgi:hypothetical protein